MIETHNLGRKFADITAVNGLSFSVSRGDVLGFLGPNGAGKSTTMKMITGFLTPSFGSARVCGHDIEEDSFMVRSIVGYLPENAPLYGEMEVGRFLHFIAEIRLIEPELQTQSVNKAIELTGLQKVQFQRIETLSKGFRRRVGLAQALLHDPEILILDEPTDGLDPNQKHEVRQLIRDIASEKCIILSTHILEEVEEVCNRAVIISNGEIVADDTPQSLKQRSKSYGVIYCSIEETEASGLKKALSKINNGTIVSFKTIGSRHEVSIKPSNSKDLLAEVLELVQKNKWTLKDISRDAGHLDQVFRTITTNQN